MSRLVFGFAVLMLVASLIPACGGGSGGSAGAAPPAQAASAEFKVYRSSPSVASVVVPWPSTPPPPIRNLYFVPPAANTVLLRVEVTGLVNTPVGTAGASISIVVTDNLGLQIGTATLSITAGYRPYRVVCLVPQSSSYANTFDPTFPDTAYRVQIYANPNNSASVPCTFYPMTALFYVEEGITEIVGLGITG